MQNNIVSYSDADFVGSYHLVDSNNAPLLLPSNSILRMHLRLTAADATVWLELDNASPLSNPINFINTTNSSIVSIRVPYSVLLNLPAAVYVHSLVAISSGGARTDVWQGTWTHNVGPTRWGNS